MIVSHNIKIFIFVLFAQLFLLVIKTNAQNTPFSKGVNLTGWFQVSNAESIHFGKYIKDDFENIQSLGCDVIRLPINLHSMTSGSPEYTVSPILLDHLDKVIDWAEDLNIHLILDNHSFDPSVNTDPNIGDVLNPIWRQMAEHFKERSNLIYYEILNEPHGISDNLWGNIQLEVINTIREIDSIHTIVVGPAGWNSFHNLNLMPVYSDSNLIYTFHFYDPFLFTHQGASWTEPSMVELDSIPFPYVQSQMPELPASLTGTWIQSAFNSYSYDGTVARVKEMIDIAAEFKESRHIKIFCGEFGVYIPNSDQDDRVYWYETVRSYLEEKGISWTIWDYQGGFGLFEKGSNELFDYDLNIPLVLALGLNEVEQYEYQSLPDSLGFTIYADYIEKGIFASNWISQGSASFIDNLQPFEGDYSISWKNVAQYNHIGFDFIPNRDFSYLLESDFILSFYLKGDTPGQMFDVRFLDSENDFPGDHPWRMRFTIDESVVPLDNYWHKVEINLNDFTEHGSWDDDNWYEPIGAFDWKDIDKLEFVAEHSSLSGIAFYIDKIEITDPGIVPAESEKNIYDYRLVQNYPNPFNPSTTINFVLKKEGTVKLVVYDILGQEVRVLVNHYMKAGSHKIIFDAANLSSGMYTYSIKVNDFLDSKKMILVK